MPQPQDAAHARSSKGKYSQVPRTDDDAKALEIDAENPKSPREERPKKFGGVVRAVAATALYCLAGPCLIFLNKHILVDIDFPYGSFLSLMGLCLSTCLSGGALYAGLASSEQLAGMTPSFYATRVGPIGAALALCLTTGNVAYLYNSVAFVQILKAFAPVVLMVLLFVSRLERPSTVLVLSILIISAGTAVAVQGEVHMSAYGVAVMLASEVFEAVKLITMQILLVDRKFGSVEGLFVMGPAAIVSLAITSLLLEDVGDACAKVAANPLPFVAASMGGVVVNLATNLMVQATSALTLRITSLVRNFGVVIVSTWVVGDSHITDQEYAGFFFSVLGVAMYQHARKNPGISLGQVFADLRGLVCPAAAS